MMKLCYLFWGVITNLDYLCVCGGGGGGAFFFNIFGPFLKVNVQNSNIFLWLLIFKQFLGRPDIPDFFW